MKDILLMALAVFWSAPIIWTIVLLVVACKLVMWWQNFRDAANEWVRKLP